MIVPWWLLVGVGLPATPRSSPLRTCHPECVGMLDPVNVAAWAAGLLPPRMMLAGRLFDCCGCAGTAKADQDDASSPGCACLALPQLACCHAFTIHGWLRLQATRVGVTVAKLRKVQDKAVAALASELVKAWKAVAKAAKSPRPTPAKSPLTGKPLKGKPAAPPKRAGAVASTPLKRSSSASSTASSVSSAASGGLSKQRSAVRSFFVGILSDFIKAHPESKVGCGPHGFASCIC